MNRQLRTQPGLIDLQVNGYAGHDVNADDVDVETLADLTHARWAQGVTTYLPTVITASEEKITHVLAVIAAARRSDPLLAHSIAGIHVEGPRSRPTTNAGYDARRLLTGHRELERWRRARTAWSGRHPRPQRAGAAEYIAAATAGSAHLARPHPGPERNATPWGRPEHPPGQWHARPLRTTSVVPAREVLTAMLIADSHHLPAETLTVMIRAGRRVLPPTRPPWPAAPRAVLDPGGLARQVGRRSLRLPGTDLLAGSAAQRATASTGPFSTFPSSPRIC